MFNFIINKYYQEKRKLSPVVSFGKNYFYSLNDLRFVSSSFLKRFIIKKTKAIAYDWALSSSSQAFKMIFLKIFNLNTQINMSHKFMWYITFEASNGILPRAGFGSSLNVLEEAREIKEEKNSLLHVCKKKREKKPNRDPIFQG